MAQQSSSGTSHNALSLEVLRIAREIAREDGRDFAELHPEVQNQYIAIAAGIEPAHDIPLEP